MAKTKTLRELPAQSLERRRAAIVARLGVPAGLIRASYVRQNLTCGKTNCRCRRGFKHGPFHYLVQCLGPGRVRKFLLKTPEQRKAAREGVAAHRSLQRLLAELSEINVELVRRGYL